MKNENSQKSEEKPKGKKQSFLLKIASKSHEAKFRNSNPGYAYGWPMGLWFTIFFVAPLVIILVYSFMTKSTYGGVEFKFSLKAYQQIFSPSYLKIIWRTFYITLISTAITIIVALPCGYAMARSKHQTLLLILIIIPFLTNSLIRIFAWKTILGEDGLLNEIGRFFFNLFHSIGLGSKDAVFVPGKFMYTKGAIILVSIYMYLPYAILPIFTAVDRFDFSLIEAARDLGANKPTAMFKILLPGIKSGIISALIFTFIPIFGSYTVPQIVGDKNSYMLGNIIVDQINKVRNYPLASAFSMIITLISMAAIIWMLVSNKKEASLKKSSSKDDFNLSQEPLLASSVKSRK